MLHEDPTTDRMKEAGIAADAHDPAFINKTGSPFSSYSKETRTKFLKKEQQDRSDVVFAREYNPQMNALKDEQRRISTSIGPNSQDATPEQRARLAELSRDMWAQRRQYNTYVRTTEPPPSSGIGSSPPPSSGTQSSTPNYGKPQPVPPGTVPPLLARPDEPPPPGTVPPLLARPDEDEPQSSPNPNRYVPGANFVPWKNPSWFPGLHTQESKRRAALTLMGDRWKIKFGRKQ